MALTIETSHSSTIVAKSPVRALKLSRSEMHAHMADDPAFADHLVQRIAARLHRIAEELHEVDNELAASIKDATRPSQSAAHNAGQLASLATRASQSETRH
jgi:CRP-like cAMP-binding protein